jgi:hypothetical protein
MNLLKKIVVCSLFCALVSPCFAFRLDKIDAVSDFHIGWTNGIGSGINFGAAAKFLQGELKPGIEIEQLITDVNYSASINGLKLGVLLNYKIDQNMSVNAHYGNSQFRANKTFVYKDLAGNNQTIIADQLTMGSYVGISLDYMITDWGFMVTPKYLINTISGQGAVSQFDLNIGKSF